jgi:hypothetical protein
MSVRVGVASEPKCTGAGLLAGERRQGRGDEGGVGVERVCAV